MDFVKCPTCSNEYVYQVELSKYQEEQMVMPGTLRIPVGSKFYLFVCPCCDTMFDKNVAFSLNYKVQEDRFVLEKRLKSKPGFRSLSDRITEVHGDIGKSMLDFTKSQSDMVSSILKEVRRLEDKVVELEKINRAEQKKKGKIPDETQS